MAKKHLTPAERERIEAQLLREYYDEIKAFTDTELSQHITMINEMKALKTIPLPVRN